MFLDKKEKNKYTVGKYLRTLKGLRKADPSAQIIQMPKQLQQYTDELIKNGLQVKNLKFAYFRTKNGLQYPGLVADQKIDSNTVLVKAPVNILLTTRDAFLSDIEKIFVQNPKFFAKRFTSDWEDRILLSYLLYQYQKGIKSRWYNLIRNLPREIDYAVFWEKSELSKLQDSYFQKHIQSQRKRFEEDCEALIHILKNYPQFFDSETLKRQNVIWIHTHLVTRCFGKYFEYTTMVPFAQLFNHENTDVYYTMYYFPDNPHNQHEQFYQQRQLTQQEMNQCDSSDGSYEAEDFIEDDEFIPYEKVQIRDYEQQFMDKKQTLKLYRSIETYIFTFINFSDSVSYAYLSIMLKKVYEALQQNDTNQSKSMFDEIHSTNIKYVKKVKDFYNKIRRKYYSYSVRQKRKPKSQQSIEDQVDKNEKYFLDVWPKDKFDQFYMLCSTKDQFQKGSQVFFCYGRLPNKLLLTRYGFALQHNKYDHMFIKIQIEQELIQNPWLRNVLKSIQINKYKRFKIKRTKMCLELVTYFRSYKWSWQQSIELYFNIIDLDREIEVLIQCINLYKQYLSKYSSSLKQNEQKLSDKNLGYHQHFALIYRLEQQRMLTEQIKMAEYAIKTVKQMKKGRSLKQVLLQQKDSQNLMIQLMMEQYFKFFIEKK